MNRFHDSDILDKVPTTRYKRDIPYQHTGGIIMLSFMRAFKFLGFLFLFLLFLVIRPSTKSVYAEVSDTKDDFDEWERSHKGCSLSLGSVGRRFAENYEQALLTLFEEHPDEHRNPEYRVAYEEISERLSRESSTHPPVIA
jgi:hypothetical protein